MRKYKLFKAHVLGVEYFDYEKIKPLIKKRTRLKIVPTQTISQVQLRVKNYILGYIAFNGWLVHSLLNQNANLRVVVTGVNKEFCQIMYDVYLIVE